MRGCGGVETDEFPDVQGFEFVGSVGNGSGDGGCGM